MNDQPDHRAKFRSMDEGTPEDWAVIAFASVAPVVLGQAWKTFRARRTAQ